MVDETDEVCGVLYNATVQLNDEVIGGFGGSEILVCMRREEEAGISGGEDGDYGGEGDLALVSEWMFFTALKW